jgi:hypothetical protein
MPASGFTPLSKDSSQTEKEIYDSRFQFTIGLFLPSINSTAQLNSSVGILGTIFNLETVFNLPKSKNLPRINGLFRIDNRHSVEGYYYALNRSGRNVSTDSIVFGNIIIPVSATIDGSFNSSLFGGKYRYSIYNSESIEAGFSIGLSFLDVSLRADVEFQNAPSGSEEYDDLLFLPVIGFFNRLNIIRELIFRSNIDMFALDIDTYDGILFDFTLSLEYLFYELFSVGISYSAFSLNVNFDKKYTGKILHNHKGFMFFAKVYL